MDSSTQILLTSLILMILMLFSSFGYAWYHNMRLYFYLMKNNHDRWKTLTTIGPGVNPVRWLKYLFNTEDNHDNNIVKAKDNVKTGLKYSLFVVLGIAVNLLMIIYVNH